MKGKIFSNERHAQPSLEGVCILLGFLGFLAWKELLSCSCKHLSEMIRSYLLITFVTFNWGCSTSQSCWVELCIFSTLLSFFCSLISAVCLLGLCGRLTARIIPLPQMTVCLPCIFMCVQFVWRWKDEDCWNREWQRQGWRRREETRGSVHSLLWLLSLKFNFPPVNHQNHFRWLGCEIFSHGCLNFASVKWKHLTWSCDLLSCAGTCAVPAAEVCSGDKNC